MLISSFLSVLSILLFSLIFSQRKILNDTVKWNTQDQNEMTPTQIGKNTDHQNKKQSHIYSHHLKVYLLKNQIFFLSPVVGVHQELCV